MEEFWNKNLSNSNNIAIIATKILHMSVVGNITFFLGCLFSINLDRLSSSEERRNKKHTLELLMEIFLFVSGLFISHYLIRNLLQYINESILTEVFYWTDQIGYDMTKLKSLGGGVIIAFAMFSFANKFKSNFHYLFIERLKLQNVDKLINENIILKDVKN